MSKISEKQKLLNKLEKQLADLQQEIAVLQDSNPVYKQTWDKLNAERDSLLVTTGKVNSFTFQNFIEIQYKWKSVGAYPEIVGHKFLCNSIVADFLEKTIVEYEMLEDIFDVEEDNIVKIKKNLDSIDYKVNIFNKKVKKAIKEFEEDQLSDLLIP